ncbi:MAG: hypothetical protein U0821_04600 [Chloroflexota bacterium]
MSEERAAAPRSERAYSGERRTWAQPEIPAGGPVVPRPASSVLLVRDGDSGDIELYMVRRPPASSFAADVFVFPGGGVAPADWSAESLASAPSFDLATAWDSITRRGGEPPERHELAFGFFYAAARELFEEAGVLLAPAASPAGLEPLRARLTGDQPGLAGLLRQDALSLDLAALIPFSHWVTPAYSPRRFDTRFFVAALPAGQIARYCGVETTEGAWVTPRGMLDRCARGEVKMVHVTIEHLERVSRFSSVDDLLAYARSKSIRTVHPELDAQRGTWAADTEAEAW